MKRNVILLGALIMLLANAASAGELAKPYTLTLGEMIELHCGIWDGLCSFSSQGLLGGTYTATIYYSKAADILQVVYLGEKDSIDNAKAVLDMLNQQVVPKITEYAKTKFAVDIPTSYFLLIYRNKYNDKDILMMENDQYVFPK
jgi:hypothetical protein